MITVYMRSLTEHWDGKLISVIVSGYDGDGVAALCGIKEVGALPSRRNRTDLLYRIAAGLIIGYLVGRLLAFLLFQLPQKTSFPKAKYA